jgi:sarcosine oxidase subunit beta
MAGFYLAIGTSGNQFKNAPVVGRLMAELTGSCENGYDHDREPVKLTGPYTGHVLNAGFYFPPERTANGQQFLGGWLVLLFYIFPVFSFN